jgi:hypothetical protein
MRNYSRFFFYHFSKYYMNILSGDFNAKVTIENIFKPTIGIESQHQDGKDNGVRICHIKKLVVKSTMFPHRNIHKYAWLTHLLSYLI